MEGKYKWVIDGQWCKGSAFMLYFCVILSFHKTAQMQESQSHSKHDGIIMTNIDSFAKSGHICFA